MVYQLAFQSELVASVCRKTLDDIATRAHDYNQQHNITGALLYQDRHILQFLEGPRKDITHLYHQIKSDPRHMNMKLIGVFLLDGRNFAGRYLDIKPIDAQYKSKLLDMLYNFKRLPGKHIIAA